MISSLEELLLLLLGDETSIHTLIFPWLAMSEKQQQQQQQLIIKVAADNQPHH